MAKPPKYPKRPKDLDQTTLDYVDKCLEYQAKRAEFEAILSPATVVFDATWPSGGIPQLGVGFEHGDRRHAIMFKQSDSDDVTDVALNHCRENRARLLAKVGIE